MHIDHFILNLEKRSDKNGLDYQVGEPAMESAMRTFEERHEIKVPLQVRLFYQKCNGLVVEVPPLEITPIENLDADETGKIIFATFNQKHLICFDTSQLNAASQWDILNYDTNFHISLTMASFWSNKIFAWLDKRRTIWQEETY